MSLRALGAAGIVLASIAAVALACSDAKPPVGDGNTVINDTHSAPTSPPHEPPPYDGDAAADGYAPFAACQACKCPASSSYCLGGTTGRTSIESCALPDGGPDAEPNPPQIGCNYFPPECAKTPTCTCLLDALKPHFPCYPVCAQTNGGPLTVYCPHP